MCKTPFLHSRIKSHPSLRSHVPLIFLWQYITRIILINFTPCILKIIAQYIRKSRTYHIEVNKYTIYYSHNPDLEVKGPAKTNSKQQLLIFIYSSPYVPITPTFGRNLETKVQNCMN